MSAQPDGSDERRRHHRFPIVAAVRIYSGEAMWNSRLIDVSLRGALVERPESWKGEPESLFRLDLRLEGGPGIGMGVRLVRAGDSELAFACQKIDLDSFAQLKRLIELNLGNVAALNRELSQLGS
jgi:hypothetical protein